MPTNFWVLVVLASQAVLISYVFPRALLARIRHVVETYPPSRYPKLYLFPLDGVRRTLTAYRVANGFVLAVGLALVASGFLAPSEELLRWDTQSVLTLYVVLQIAPLIVIGRSPGFTFFNTKRRPDTSRTRSALLVRRDLFDFISPWAIAFAVLVYVGFVLFVLLVPQLWPGGWWNVVGVTGLNAFFAIVIFRTIYGKTSDPYMAYPDRLRQIEGVVKVCVYVSISGTLYLVIVSGLNRYDSRLSDIVQSLYVQLIFLLNLWTIRIDEVDFEVYRETPEPESTPL